MLLIHFFTSHQHYQNVGSELKIVNRMLTLAVLTQRFVEHHSMSVTRCCSQTESTSPGCVVTKGSKQIWCRKSWWICELFAVGCAVQIHGSVAIGYVRSRARMFASDSFKNLFNFPMSLKYQSMLLKLCVNRAWCIIVSPLQKKLVRPQNYGHRPSYPCSRSWHGKGFMKWGLRSTWISYGLRFKIVRQDCGTAEFGSSVVSVIIANSWFSSHSDRAL